MAEKCSWENLPSVIIVDILSCLSVTDKAKATSTCKRWRNCLFHPSLWRSVNFSFKYGARRKARFLTDAVGRFGKDVTIEFNSKFFADVVDCLRLLRELGKNGNLEKLILKPFSFQVAWPGRDLDRGRHDWDENEALFQDLYLDAIDHIIQNSRHLRQLSLGCIPELTDHTTEILHLLERHQPHTIHTLHLASVKEDPDSYPLLDFPLHQNLRCFKNLHTVSMDYDYLSNDLLMQFANRGCGAALLEKLILHVHGLEPGREKITNTTWAKVTKANPTLGVTLSLIHSVDGLANITDILQPSLPLVHFRMFFCQGMSIAGITFMSRHMGSRVESIHVVEGLDRGVPMVYDYVEDADPFVMLAWKCPNLKHFTMIGYDMCSEDIVAIARLRGPQLETFCVPQCCISVIVDDDDDETELQAKDATLISEVSSSLGRPWKPVPDDKLPDAVLDPMADAESAYLSVLLLDQF